MVFYPHGNIRLSAMLPAVVVFCLSAAITSSGQIAPSDASKNLININPDPNGEPWIAGGIDKAEFEAALSSMAPLETPSPSHAAKPLPTKIDNTAFSSFRPIFNQQGGSCSQASSIGYVYTYEINYLRGLAASVTSNQYPYDFTYNFINAGSGNNGGLPEQAWAIVKALGVPNVASYGGFGLGKFNQWVSGYPVYFNAMGNRVDSYFRINTATPAGVTQMKQWLNDHQNGSSQGGCLVMCYYAQNEVLGTIPTGKPEAGKKLMYKFGSTGGHAVTIAGYNDSVCWDFNGDGKYTNSNATDVKTWEIGAYLMVNSWGSSFGNSGKVWIPYRMLALGEPTGIWYSTLYGMKTPTEKTCKPQLTYKILMTHSNRSQIRIRAGYANSASATAPTGTPKNFANAFNYSGGAFPMLGSNNNNAIEIGLDVSDFLPNLTSSSVSFFLLIDSKGGTGSVSKFSLMDYTQDSIPVELTCSQTNVNLPTGTTTLKITKTLKSLTVLTPNGGEKLERGRTFTVTWNDRISENVKIELLKSNSVFSTIASSAPSSGTFNWTVPSDIALASDYRVKVSSVSDANTNDISDSNFTIQEKTTLTLTTPAGGEILEKGKAAPITWSTNATGNVKIELYKDKMPDTTIVGAAAASLGAWSWTPPATIPSGYTYTLHITSLSNSLVFDESKSYFTIINPMVSAPYSQNFDGQTAKSTSLSGSWEQALDDDLDWTTFNGPTPSRVNPAEGATGPGGDHTSGNGNYTYVEASGPSNTPGKEAVLLSPMISVAGIASSKIDFWYHMYSKDAHMGSLLVDVYANNIWKDSAIVLSGDKGDKWLEQPILVNQLFPQFSAPITRIQVRFRAITGTAYDSDICLDDFSVTSAVTPTVFTSAAHAINPSMRKIGDRVYYKGMHGPLSIFMLNGVKMMSMQTSGTGQCDISKLPKGLYMAKWGNEMIKFVK